METLVKRKNLKARKGKQRWRKNIDVSGLQNQQLQSQMSDGFNKKKEQLLSYTLDSQKNQNIYLNKDRFKKQLSNPKLKSKVDSKLESKIFEKLNRVNKEIVYIDHSLQKSFLSQSQHNPWTNEPQATTKNDNQHLDRPKFLVVPQGGQSYNPKQEQYNQLMDSVVQKELQNIKKVTLKDPIIQANKLIEQDRTRKLKAKLSRIHREQGKEMIDQLDLKKTNHQFTLLKVFKKDMNDREDDLQQRKSKRQQEKVDEQEAFKNGKLPKTIKLGKRIYKNEDDDFLMEEELPEKLRNLTTGDRLVHNQFKSIFRRRMLEPKGISNKLRKPSFPKFKTKERNDDDKLPFQHYNGVRQQQ